MTTIALLTTLAVSLLYVRSRFLLVEMSHAISQSQQEKAQLEQQKRMLTVELATLKSPRRIERIASQELGLTRAQGPIRTVRLSDTNQEKSNATP
jgi:cell division protein FtsL